MVVSEESALHHQDNRAGNTAIKDVISVLWNVHVVSREIFFQGDKAGGIIYLLYIENRKKTTLSSRQACFEITRSSRDFTD